MIKQKAQSQGHTLKETAFIKTNEEVEALRKVNSIVSIVLKELSSAVKYQKNVTTKYLDSLAERIILGFGAEPGFKKFSNFPYTITASVDNVVVQGFPSDAILTCGSILSVDVSAFKNGYYGDSAVTIPVGEISYEKQNLISVCKEALNVGIENAVKGATIKNITSCVEAYVNKCGFNAAKRLTGHGIGKRLHEYPSIPNRALYATTLRLKQNMVIAIEPIIFSIGDEEEQDGSWAWKTKNGSCSAHFEHTVLITDSGNEVLSI